MNSRQKLHLRMIGFRIEMHHSNTNIFKLFCHPKVFGTCVRIRESDSSAYHVYENFDGQKYKDMEALVEVLNEL